MDQETSRNWGSTTSSDKHKRPPCSSYCCSLLCTFRNARIITVEPQYYYLRYALEQLRNTSFESQVPNGSFCLNSSEVDDFAGNGTYKTVETFSIHLVLYTQLANQIPAIFLTFITGPLADKFGRKPALIAIGVGKTLQAALSLVIVYFNWSPFYFIIAYFLSGLTGDFPAVIAGSYSYIADVSSKKWRSFRFGIMQTMLCLGAALGQFLGGYWLNLINCDFMPPMWFYLACCIALVLYVMVFLPESLSSIERKKIAEKNPKGLKATLQGLKMFFGKLPKYKHVVWKLWLSTISYLLVKINALGFEYVYVYFLKAPPFNFSPLFVGIALFIYTSSAGLSSTFLVGILVALRTPDILISLIGVIFQGGCFLMTGLSRKTYQILIFAALQGVDAVSWTGLIGFRSKLVALEDQGALFATVASAEAVTSIFSTVLWTNIYAVVLKHSEGRVFFFMAAVALLNAVLLILLLIFSLYKKVKPQPTPKETQAFPEDPPEEEPLLKKREVIQ